MQWPFRVQVFQLGIGNRLVMYNATVRRPPLEGLEQQDEI